MLTENIYEHLTKMDLYQDSNNGGNMKKKIIFICLTGMLCSVFTLILIHTKDKPAEKPKYSSLVLLGTEDEYGDIENLSYYSDTGGSCDELVIEDITNVVFIENEYILFENGLDDYGINSLDDYILRYLNHYIGDDIYTVKVLENSFEKDVNYPSFVLNVSLKNNLEITYSVKCIYKTHSQRYSFYCEEIENHK